MVINFNYPDWYNIEKNTLRILQKLNSAKELSFYFRSPDQFIRRLAILRVADLHLKEGIPYLTEIIENHSEDQINRELSAWAVKVISIKCSEDIFITNRLLTHFTGNESLEDLLGNTEIIMPDYSLNLTFDVPKSNTIDITKNYIEFNNDFIIEDSFSWKEWSGNYCRAFMRSLNNSYKLAVSSPCKLFSKIYFTFINKFQHLCKKANESRSNIKIFKNKRLLFKIPPRIYVKLKTILRSYILNFKDYLLFVICLPFKFARTHKILTSFTMFMLFMFAINIPWISRPLEQHTNIKPNEINQIVYGLSHQFLTMVSEGAADLLNGEDTVEQTSKINDTAEIQTTTKVFSVTAVSGLSLRTKPYTSGARIDSPLSYQTKLTYMNSEQKNEDGSLWYLVKAPDGRVGWVNSKWLK